MSCKVPEPAALAVSLEELLVSELLELLALRAALSAARLASATCWTVLVGLDVEAALVPADAESPDCAACSDCALCWLVGSPERVQLGTSTAKISSSTMIASAMGTTMGGMRSGMSNGKSNETGPISTVRLSPETVKNSLTASLADESGEPSAPAF